MSMNSRIDLVTLTDPGSPVSEAFRSLCTNLTFSALDTQLRTLLVTSAGAGEGKSTIVANLAVAFAERGVRTLVVDCDLRHPAQHRIFALPNDQGLTSLFLDKRGQTDLPLWDVSVDNLCVLPSGPLPLVPSQLLGSRKLPEIVALLSERADVVLFDTPPLIAVPDASMLAPYVDGVLLAVTAGRSTRQQLRRAKQRLAQVQANLVGAVVINVPLAAGLRHYYD